MLDVQPRSPSGPPTPTPGTLRHDDTLRPATARLTRFSAYLSCTRRAGVHGARSGLIPGGSATVVGATSPGDRSGNHPAPVYIIVTARGRVHSRGKNSVAYGRET